MRGARRWLALLTVSVLALGTAACGSDDDSDAAASGKLVDVRETDLATTILADDGVRRALAEQCPDCEIVETVKMVGTDIGEPIQQKVAQAFARNSDANATVSPYDGVTPNIAAAVVASGRKDQIWAMGAEGLPRRSRGSRTTTASMPGSGSRSSGRCGRRWTR